MTVNLAPVSTHRSKWVPLGDYIASNTDECTATLKYAVNLKQSGTVSFEYYYADSNIIFEFFVSCWPRGRVGGRNAPWLGCTCRNQAQSCLGNRHSCYPLERTVGKRSLRLQEARESEGRRGVWESWGFRPAQTRTPHGMASLSYRLCLCCQCLTFCVCD